MGCFKGFTARVHGEALGGSRKGFAHVASCNTAAASSSNYLLKWESLRIQTPGLFSLPPEGMLGKV